MKRRTNRALALVLSASTLTFGAPRQREARPEADHPPTPAVARYGAGNLRSPFEPAPTTLAGTHPSSVQPDAERKQGPLEAFALDELHLVGTIATDGEASALVKDPGGTIHRLETGDYMGKHHGRLTLVREADIVLQETIRDGGGGWMRRTRVVAIDASDHADACPPSEPASACHEAAPLP